MECPFCGSVMVEFYKAGTLTHEGFTSNKEPLEKLYVCNEDGPLIKNHKKYHPNGCPLHGKRMTKEDIDRHIVALIDAEME